MSDIGKTITISNEAYLEIKRLNQDNARLKSLVEATETDLFDQKKKRRRLEKENAALKKENETLSISIKGVTGAKVNLNKTYQELEGLYERLEEENHKCQMREEKYSKQAQRAFDKADSIQEALNKYKADSLKQCMSMSCVLFKDNIYFVEYKAVGLCSQVIGYPLPHMRVKLSVDTVIDVRARSEHKVLRIACEISELYDGENL